MAPEVVTEADFRTLGLEPGSDPSEVRRAYRTLVKKWHPDRHHLESYESRALAEEKFREIDEAYRRISGRWKETARPTGFSRKAAGLATKSFQGSQRPGAKPRTDSAARSRVKIDLKLLSRAKIVLTVLLLLAAAAFILTRLPPFSPHRAVDTENKDSLQPPVPELNTPESTFPGQASGAGPGGRTGLLSDDQPRRNGAADNRSNNGLQLPGPRLHTTGAGTNARKGLFSDERSGQGWAADRLLSLPPDLFNPRPAAPSSFFTLGSTSSEVLAVQGTPSRVQGQTWTYGLCEVQFRNGRVWQFNNFDGSLRVRMQPEVAEGRAQPDHITIGSSEQEVLALQGTPTRVEGNKWFYGFAEIVFKNGRIAEYDNYFGTLKMRIIPSRSGSERSKDVFRIGSSPDEVLAVQGTPTAIHGNRWSFEFASVLFREGKVHSVTDAGGTLRFAAPEGQ